MTDQPVRCENVACPDPGPHAHTIDSRDDLDAARWGGYWPMRPDAARIITDTLEAPTMRTYSELSHPSPVVPFLLGDDEYVSRCPACGAWIDYCSGHGPIGDPIGARILDAHDDGDHSECDPRGCDDAPAVPFA